MNWLIKMRQEAREIFRPELMQPQYPELFGGVREEGSVASPDPSSSDPTRRNPTNQETVA